MSVITKLLNAYKFLMNWMTYKGPLRTYWGIFKAWQSHMLQEFLLWCLLTRNSQSWNQGKRWMYPGFKWSKLWSLTHYNHIHFHLLVKGDLEVTSICLSEHLAHMKKAACSYLFSHVIAMFSSQRGDQQQHWIKRAAIFVPCDTGVYFSFTVLQNSLLNKQLSSHSGKNNEHLDI